MLHVNTDIAKSSAFGKNLYEKFDYVRSFFEQADDILNKSLSKIILDGSKGKNRFD